MFTPRIFRPSLLRRRPLAAAQILALCAAAWVVSSAAFADEPANPPITPGASLAPVADAPNDAPAAEAPAAEAPAAEAPEQPAAPDEAELGGQAPEADAPPAEGTAETLPAAERQANGDDNETQAGATTTEPRTEEASSDALPPPDAQSDEQREQKAYDAGYAAGTKQVGMDTSWPFVGASLGMTCCGSMCGGVFAALPYVGVLLGPLMAGVVAIVGSVVGIVAATLWSPSAPDKALDVDPETFGEGYEAALDEEGYWWRVGGALAGAGAGHALSIAAVWGFAAAWFVVGAVFVWAPLLSLVIPSARSPQAGGVVPVPMIALAVFSPRSGE